jgi:hypothetical protein
MTPAAETRSAGVVGMLIVVARCHVRAPNAPDGSRDRGRS